MRLFHRHFASFIALAFAFLTPILEPAARFGDRVINFGLTVFDHMLPFTEMSTAGYHPAMPTREVTYLTTGLHRMAQPVSMRGPNDDDEDGTDEIDNGYPAQFARLTC